MTRTRATECSASPAATPLERISLDLVQELKPLRFGPPVSHVYRPLEYAWEPHRRYLRRYGERPKQVLLVGMNPGPWGMAQTGIPFGEVGAVREWMGIEGPVGCPDRLHPKRPVPGFGCARSEASGSRLWGWARQVFGSPERFFRRFFVANYCPLMFIDADGANRTPDKLRKADIPPLTAACDRALRRTVEHLGPEFVVGVGRFAAERAQAALQGLPLTVGAVTHPSPANPKANRGWAALVTAELARLGIAL
jgi:single-strand selective monofunctional uracil DNA glycosylase